MTLTPQLFASEHIYYQYLNPFCQFNPEIQEVEGIEIVFVSSDQSADDMASYMKVTWNIVVLRKMLLHSKERYSHLHNFIHGHWLFAQEAHGDWFAVEHNSAAADNLSQNMLRLKCDFVFNTMSGFFANSAVSGTCWQKKSLHNCFETIKVSLVSDAPLQEFL